MATLPKDRLYVSGLPPGTKEGDVLALFSKVDKVTDVHIGLNPWDGTCRGYVHATCSSEQAAQRCIQALHRSHHQGSIISVELAKPRYYEMQQERQLQYSAKQNGKAAPPLQRTPYADRPRKEQRPPSQVVTRISTAAESSSSSDSSSDSDADKQGTPAVQPKVVKRKIIVKKIIKRPAGTVASATKSAVPEVPPAVTSPPAVPEKAPVQTPSPAVTPAPRPAPEPELTTVALPEAGSEPPKKKVKIIKKVVKRPAAPAASETSATAASTPVTAIAAPAAPAGSESAAKPSAQPLSKLSQGLTAAWTALLERVTGQGLTEEMLLECSQSEFEDILTDLGITGLQKVSLRNCFLQKKGTA